MRTKHFNPKSDRMMDCPCGCGTGLQPSIMVVLEVIREHFGVPVTITSGVRCKKYNSTIKGASKGSKHILGIAVDMKVKGVDPLEVYKFLDESGFSGILGLGIYWNRIHVDVRGSKARWDTTK